MTHDEAVETLLANTEDAYGFPPFSVMERAITLRKKGMHQGQEAGHREAARPERGILESFLETCRSTRLISPELRVGGHHPGAAGGAGHGRRAGPRTTWRQPMSAGR